MKHEVAAVDRLRPSLVGREVGDGESQCVLGVGAGTRHHVSHICLAFGRSHRRADAVGRVQQCCDAMRADESRATGHQNLCVSP